MITQLKSGNIYDPHNKICNLKNDVFIQDGKIIDKKDVKSKVDKVINCSDKIIMPGAIDIHTHIGGGKVNIARLMLEEFHNEKEPGYDSSAIIAPSTLKTGLKYIEMGYTTCLEPALLPINARQAHAEMSDIPFIDKGGYALLGNDDYFLDLLRKKSSQSTINDYVAFILSATPSLGIKVVNPGGINAFKFNQRALNVDEKSKYYGITPREIVEKLTRAIYDLGVPHPLHVHCSNLGIPGNFLSTIETIKAANGLPIHLTHIQFQSYGNNGDKGFSSAAVEISNYLNKIGWKIHQPCFYKVELKDSVPKKYLNTSAKKIHNKKKLYNFEKYIQNYNEIDLNKNILTAIVTPDKDIIPDAENLSPAYLIFSNYELILKWNRSLRFALAVCTLKNEIKNAL